jgi:ferric-dicitrate binding protein FerR (iron transport regulator)
MMPLDDHTMDDLLVKYLAGEATPEERLQAEQWISANETNRKYYKDFNRIWQESERIPGESQANENAAWMRLQNRINKSDVDVEQHVRREPRPDTQWLKIAVSILLVGIVSYWVYNRFYDAHIIEKLSRNKVLTENLSDGSTVTLNSNSQLSYPAHFTGDNRPVKLTGEAFFKIAPDKTKPFIISVKGATISVVGTSFDVKNRKGETEVIVATGIVKVKAHGKEVQLYPGEKVMVTKTSNELVKQQNKGSLYNYYITGALVCDQTPLYQLVDKLNEVYKVDIEITNDKLRNLPITTTFKDQSLDEILKVIAETFNIRVERQGNRFLLK